MRKKVEHYQGEQINFIIISKLFAISAARDFKVEGIIPYSDIDTLEELCEVYECNPDEFHIILGADWYLTYITRPEKTEIIEWVSLENRKDKIHQTLEMMKYLIQVLLLSKEKKVTSTMRHSTSYKFYQLLIKNGYIKEQYNNPGMDTSIPDDIQSELDIAIEDNINIKYYLDNPNRNTEYDEYFYHDISFTLTNKFLTRYDKTIKK
ncbi:MAG: hypothetical protein ACI4XM_01995 [Candidatus Coprovivens sp.]